MRARERAPGMGSHARRGRRGGGRHPWYGPSPSKGSHGPVAGAPGGYAGSLSPVVPPAARGSRPNTGRSAMTALGYVRRSKESTARTVSLEDQQ